MNWDAATKQRCAAAMCSALQLLPQLQCLSLQSTYLIWQVSEGAGAAEHQGGAISASRKPQQQARASVLASLKDLQLSHCDLPNPEALVALVLRAPGLTRLEVSNPAFEDPAGGRLAWDAASQQRCAAAMCSALHQLPQLHYLRLGNVYLTWQEANGGPAVAEHRGGTTSTSCKPQQQPRPSVLASLEDLQLSNCHLSSPEALVALVSQAPGLTRLMISFPSWYSYGNNFINQRVEAAICPMLHQLRQITVLHLRWLPLGNAACQLLAAMSNL